MRIAGVYSFNNGKEIITQQHRPELDEVLQIIEQLMQKFPRRKSAKKKPCGTEYYIVRPRSIKPSKKNLPVEVG